MRKKHRQIRRGCLAVHVCKKQDPAVYRTVRTVVEEEKSLFRISLLFRFSLSPSGTSLFSRDRTFLTTTDRHFLLAKMELRFHAPEKTTIPFPSAKLFPHRADGKGLMRTIFHSSSCF